MESMTADMIGHDLKKYQHLLKPPAGTSALAVNDPIAFDSLRRLRLTRRPAGKFHRIG